MLSKVHIKVEQIARLRVAGSVSDERIAHLLGLTRAGLSRILALPEYKEAEESALTGTISKMDEALAGKAAEIRKVYAVAVPMAMKALLETVVQKKDLRARMQASIEVLDRDPDRTFSKNRVELPSGATMPAEMLRTIVEEGDAVAVEVAAGTASEPVQKEVVQ